MRNMNNIMALCFRIRYEVFCVCLLLSIYSLSQAAEQPGTDAPIHLGVATCAGSNCHGANAPHRYYKTNFLPGIVRTSIPRHIKFCLMMSRNESHKTWV